MPDPTWDFEYNFGSSPESNDFTRIISGSPVVTETISGPINDRNVDIDAANGDVVFLANVSPPLLFSVGTTAEWDIQVSGSGSAGLELTFPDGAFVADVYQNKVEIHAPGSPGNQITSVIATSDNSSRVIWRLTVDTSRDFRVYRAGVLIGGPTTMPVITTPNARSLWWAESGVSATFWQIKLYWGGATAPG